MNLLLNTRARLIGLVVTMLCLLGLASYLTMARQEDPSFPQRAGMITVIYPGAMAEAVERMVLEPLSDELSQVEEIDYFTATARTGVVLISINLEDRIYDTDSAWDRVRQAMERARLEFPDGVARMSLDDRLIDIPAVVLAVRGDASLVQLSQQAERLKRALMDLPGVSRIELEGEADEQITIALRDAEMRRLGLTPQQLSTLLAQRNQVIPGGFVVVDDKRLGVLPNSEFTSIEALRGTQIPLPEGGSVPLAAIADVWRGPLEPAQPQAWFDGEQAVLVSLTAQRGQVDAIRFGEQLRERLDLLRDEFQPLQIDEMFFQPDQVKERLDSLELSLLLSVLIIVAVVLVGMGWRMGVLVATMLPLVAMISLGLYNFGGGVLHQIAVIGMVISLGILIDNAIVMVENIQDRLNRGASRAHAMHEAVRELAGPLGASTATTLAAFTPLLLAKGGTADFTRGIPVMIMLTLSVSYLLAISVAPLIAGRFLKPAASLDSPLMERLGAGLARVSGRFPWLVVLFGLVMVIISLGMTPWMKQQFFPYADRPVVVVELHMPEGTDQQRTADVAADLERELRGLPQVQAVHRFVGSAGPSFYYNLLRSPESPNRGRLVVQTTDLAATGEVIHWVREHVARQRPELDVVAERLGQGPPRVAPVEVRLYHPDDRQRIAAAEQVFTALKAVEGAVDVRHDVDLGVPVLAIEVDDAQAQRLGVSRAEVARALFSQSLGLTVEQYRQELDPIPMLLRSHEGTRQSLERLLSLHVFNQAGEAIPLTALARIEARWLPASIRQRNGVRVYSVTAGLEDGYSFNQVLDALDRQLQVQPLPPGTRLELGGDSEGSGDANRALATSAPVGMLLLLFFLLLQFNSFRRVGIILLTVPLASVGIFPGLVLSGSPFGFQSMLGVIALVGIVVNNAIVLLDLVDQRLAVGKAVGEAVSEAVQRRTRPILLTTATTIAGLLPLAFSSSTLWPPMAWAIISGLLASTVLTLLVIPAVCRLSLKPKVQAQDNKSYASA
ncbi:efflux RND transporter permease subunit [Halopseudomonas phragmitis]|uniref:Acriflavin resistance protein n=2 Tax=Pseudomonadaceae TaxID=135621 RepID=A0A1V0B840_9GAMM|nr:MULTISPECIES: efflux RND transporter permease subunit [Pseudomonadaceae]AQZ96060.1 acriflavin resistance protein [Halopseudomonas phragmitis]RHW20896.1 AcrB/AcrD/AcrF family protein [Pseudomonas jilinensis]